LRFAWTMSHVEKQSKAAQQRRPTKARRLLQRIQHELLRQD